MTTIVAGWLTLDAHASLRPMSSTRKPTSRRKTLPKDFETLLKTGDLAKLEGVFEACDVDARGGYAMQTALAFNECPDALSRWLVARGADLAATDARGNTPLHSRAESWHAKLAVLLDLGANVHATNAAGATPLHAAARVKNAENARLLIAAGAEVDAKNAEGVTPLAVALDTCNNADLAHVRSFVRVLADAGATGTPEMRATVTRIGTTFEFHRARFNKESVDEASAALDFLYETFNVTPVPRRQMHDGSAPIVVKSTGWERQHDELWQLLVPSSGAASTVQGEVIRIAGRIADEWERNGGGNWDRDYAAMARAFVTNVGTGVALAPAEIDEVTSIVRSLKKSGGDGNERLRELAVAWVIANPQPIALSSVSYRR